MNKGEFLNRVKKGEISTLYLFLGEAYYQHEALDTLKGSLFENRKEILDFNFDLLYGDEVQASSVINLANTFPLKAKRRLVVVKRVDQLPEKEREDLSFQLSQGIPSFTCLVVCAERLERSDPLYQTISKTGEIVNFWPPSDEELISFIILQAKKMGIQMDNEAVRTLVEIKGRDLFELSNELEKLLFYVGRDKSVTPEDVSMVSGGEGFRNIFDLLEAIGEGNISKGLSRLNYLAFQGEPLLKILYMIIREVHLIYKMKFLLEEGRSIQEVYSLLEISSKKSISRLMKGVKFFREESLKRNLEYLLEADKFLKSQEKKFHPLILELLVMRLAGFLEEVH